MGEVIRELETPLDGRYVVRVYAENGPPWRAWLEFISLRHGDLIRSAVLRSAAGREALLEWAGRLGDDEVRRALEDAEIVSAADLGRSPVLRVG